MSVLMVSLYLIHSSGVTNLVGSPSVLSPNIEIVVMDAVVRHCLTILPEEAAGPKVFDLSVQQMASFLYTENGLLASTWL